MMTLFESPAGFTARVTLANGELAGEGGGPNEATAAYFAVRDALMSHVDRYVTAGLGHRVYLADRDAKIFEDGSASLARTIAFRTS